MRIIKPIDVLLGQSNRCVSNEYKNNTNQKSRMEEKSFKTYCFLTSSLKAMENEL